MTEVIHVEAQFDPQRGEVRLMATSSLSRSTYTKTMPAATEAEATAVAEQFRRMYELHENKKYPHVFIPSSDPGVCRDCEKSPDAGVHDGRRDR